MKVHREFSLKHILIIITSHLQRICKKSDNYFLEIYENFVEMIFGVFLASSGRTAAKVIPKTNYVCKTAKVIPKLDKTDPHLESMEWFRAGL